MGSDVHTPPVGGAGRGSPRRAGDASDQGGEDRFRGVLARVTGLHVQGARIQDDRVDFIWNEKGGWRCGKGELSGEKDERRRWPSNSARTLFVSINYSPPPNMVPGFCMATRTVCAQGPHRWREVAATRKREEKENKKTQAARRSGLTCLLSTPAFISNLFPSRPGVARPQHMQPSVLPPKKRTPSESPPPPPSPSPGAPPGLIEISKIRGTAPPRSPRIGPAFQTDLPDLLPKPPPGRGEGAD